MKNFKLLLVLVATMLFAGCAAKEPATPPVEYVYITTTPAPTSEPQIEYVYVTATPGPTSAPTVEYVYVTATPGPTSAPTVEYVYVTATPGPTSAPTVEYVYVTATPGPTATPVVEYVYVTTTPAPTATPVVIYAENSLQKVSGTKDKLVLDEFTKTYNGSHIDWDTTNANFGVFFYGTSYKEPKYFVGRGSTGSYLATVAGQYDIAVFLDLPFNMAAKYNLNGEYGFSVSDNTVGVVENGVFIPKKQGLTTVTIKDYAGKNVKTVRIAVTTYNDGRPADNNAYNRDWLYTFNAMDDAETARLTINSIDEAVCYFIGKYWCYRDHQPDCLYNVNWMYSQSGKTNLEINTGVCTDVANAATYLLQGNYEDWGYILIKGRYGHVLNWFYEDGNYYVIDFTEVIGDNPYAEFMKYRPGYCHTFKNTDEISTFIKAHYGFICDEDTSLVYMYSALGHHTQNADFDPQCQGRDGDTEGYLYGIEECEYNSMTILFQSATKSITIIPVPTEDMPMMLLKGENTHYNDATSYQVYYNY